MRDSFRWPHWFAATGSQGLIVTDAGDHRLLRWDTHHEQDPRRTPYSGRLTS